MAFPMKTCVVCGEEFELRPGKPGFANRCLECTEAEAEASGATQGASAEERRQQAAMDEARRGAIRDLLYRKDS